MVVDVRKLSNGAGPARPVYQHAHFCVRLFHLLFSHPFYSLFVFFLMYLQMMDIILYFRIRSRGPLDFSSMINNNTLSNSISETDSTIHIFDPLPVKKIMIESFIHYVRSPLAEQVEATLHFSYYFPFISANAISYFHCFLSLVSLKFIAHESLYRRRLGVFIFQIRTFLDCLDGVIFRAHIKNKRYRSYYGSFGYYVDMFSDIFGGTCLMIGCLLYFYKQRPARSNVSTRPQISSSSTTNESSYGETEKTLNHSDDELMATRLNLLSSNNDAANNNHLETKSTIFMTLVFFSLRYSLAAFFWDRSVNSYEELLDSHSENLQKQVAALQLSILHSPLTILIFYLWRYLSALSIQDYLMFVIFIDRTWEFIQRTKTISWCILFSTIFLTELHINQIRSLFDVLSNS